jgi:hypothetical protein
MGNAALNVLPVHPAIKGYRGIKILGELICLFGKPATP